MGTYIYTLRKKTVEAIVLPEYKKVTVALVKFFCKEYRGIEETRAYKTAVTRVKKLIEGGFKPDFYTTNFDSGSIYNFKGFGFLGDTPDLGKLYGSLILVGKKRFIIPNGSKIEDFQHLIGYFNKTKNKELVDAMFATSSGVISKSLEKKERVAKLVCVSFMTRVVVDKDATDEEILAAARPRFAEKVATELGENLESIEDDGECPFGDIDGDK